MVENKKNMPPGQVRVEKEWPVRTVEDIGEFVPDKWRLKITGLVENELLLTFEQIREFPFSEVQVNFHCVEGWSITELIWGGVLTRDIKTKIELKDSAKYAFLVSEGAYTTSLLVDEFFKEDALLAHRVNGKELTRDQGFPLRLIVSDKYAYKNIKYLTEIRFISEDKLGYWEKRGYHNSADIWKEERFDR